MSKLIQNYLNGLEQSHNIRILYACESGSRSFGTHTELSDYDVRFIFVHPLKNYVQLKPSGEVITVKHETTHEFHGWELIKTMRLYQKSNPTLYEWIFSPIIYVNHEHFQSRLEGLITAYYSFRTIGKHYEQLLKSNLKQLMKSEFFSLKETKAVLQCVRAWLSINWMIQFHTMPPVSYDILVRDSKISNELKHLFDQLVMMKQSNTQNDPLLWLIIDFLKKEFDVLHNQIENLPHKEIDLCKANHFIWGILGLE